MIFLFSLLTVFLSACSPPSVTDTNPGQPYAKVDLTQKETCSINKACSSSTASCIALTQQAYCFESGEDSVACTTGKLIIQQSYPGKFDCI